MNNNQKLRRIIPICSMLIALGTVAFQTIENEAKENKLEQNMVHQSDLDSKKDTALMLFKE